MTAFKLALGRLTAAAVLVTAPELAHADNLDRARHWMAQRFQVAPDAPSRPTVHQPTSQRSSSAKRVTVDRGPDRVLHVRSARGTYRDRANSAPTGSTPEHVIIYSPVIQRVYVVHW